MVRLSRLEGVAPDFVGRRRSGVGPASASASPARSLTVLAGWSPVRSGGSGSVGGAGGPGATGGRGRLRLPPGVGAGGLSADRLERVAPVVPGHRFGLVDLGGASGCPLVPVPCWPTGWSGPSPGSSGSRLEACSPRILRLVSPVPWGWMGCSSPARRRRTSSASGAGMADRQAVSSMLAAGGSSAPAAELARGDGHGVSGSGTRRGNCACGMGRGRCSSLAGVGALEAGVDVGSLTRVGAGG